MYRADLSRRIGPAFADAAVDAAFDTQDKPGYPYGWGTSPHLRRSLSKTRCALSPSSPELLETRPGNPQMAAIKVPAKAYKPAHGGYPG